MSIDHQSEILRSFATYEAAKRLEDWTAKDIPNDYPPGIVNPMRKVAREVLTQAQNELIGALHITACAWGFVPGVTDPPSEGKG